MSTRPSPGPAAAPSRVMRLAAVLLFVGGPLALASLAAVDAVRIAELRDRVDRRLIEMAPLRARITRLAPTPADTEALYLPGASRALAAAWLQRHLGTILSEHAARITTFQIEGADGAGSGEGDAGDILLRVAFEAGNAALLDSLLAIETTLPLLTVERLSVRRSAVAPPEGEAPRLDVDMVVRGFRREGTA
ncbi:type II secretion system protein GspM [Acuticoccus sp. I52.16.1]|uniref:type II secretion system protein GspM n=1 Tax=Acuticoccus sp. I52.16.1 TaxID=2928472 RepID=UPI001FD18D14|nr:type II secretion system protein GspM [Acuticoccus sp. I52.16.1]UOM34669.1 type II secretion system protein GspM [Acuticoccus sp. I52.16.1]